MKNQPTAVEEWAKEFERCKKRQLTSDEMTALTHVILNEKSINEDKELINLIKDGKPQATMAHVFYKRINALFPFFKITISVALLLEYVTINNFGHSTMIAAYLCYKAHQLKKDVIDIETLNLYIFPYGYPTNEEYERLWNLQKVKPMRAFGTDNALDYISNYQSIMPTKE